jgi:hypothetical protein
MVVIPSAFPLPLEAAAELAPPPAAGVFAADDELPLELPHADRAKARAANPAAPVIFRISKSPLHRAFGVPWGGTYRPAV